MDPYASPTIPNLLHNRANAMSSIPNQQTTTAFSPDLSLDSPPPLHGSPLAPPRSMAEVSPTTSSPSLYSRRDHSPRIHIHTHMHGRNFGILSNDDSYPSQTEEGEEEEEEDEEEVDPRKRMSMVGGPKVRKYMETSPWEDEWSSHTRIEDTFNTNADSMSGSGGGGGGFGFSKHANKMIMAATSGVTNSYSNKSRSRDPSTSTTTTSIISDLSFDNNAPSTSVTSTRRGLAQILGGKGTTTPTPTPAPGKHLLHSASGVSLASNQTTSTASFDEGVPPMTPKLRQKVTNDRGGQSSISPTGTGRIIHSGKKNKNIYDFASSLMNDNIELPRLPTMPATITAKPTTGTSSAYKKPVPNFALTDLLPLPPPEALSTVMTFAASDRPLLNSGSPGFGLISLEVAQERERERVRQRNMNSARKNNKGDMGVNPSALDAALRRVEASSNSATRVQTSFDIDVSTLPIPEDPPLALRHILTNTSAPPSPPSSGGHRVRTKKSGLMKLFNKGHQSQPSTSASANANANGISQGDRVSRTGSMWGEVTAASEGIWPTRITRKSTTASAANHTMDPMPIAISTQPPLQLELRPVSMTFTRGLPLDYLSQQAQAQGQGQVGSDCPSTPTPAPPTPKSLRKPQSTSRSHSQSHTHTGQYPPSDPHTNNVSETAMLNHDLLTKVLKDQFQNARKAWRIQLFELEAQVRELRDELDNARSSKSGTGCTSCGCTCGTTTSMTMSKGQSLDADESRRKIIDRARVKTAGARGVFGSGSLYEWE